MIFLGFIKYLELVAALVATIYYFKLKGGVLKYFVYLQWLVVSVEFCIWGLNYFYDYSFQNNFIYNILTSLQYYYFLSIYYLEMKNPVFKKWVLAFLSIFSVAILINFSAFQKLNATAPFHSFTFTLGAIALIATIGLFFIEILRSEMILHFKRYILFWLSVGMILFYSGIIPIVYSINFFPDFLDSDILCIIFFSLNLMLYACISIGIIIGKPMKNSAI